MITSVEKTWVDVGERGQSRHPLHRRLMKEFRYEAQPFLTIARLSRAWADGRYELLRCLSAHLPLRSADDITKAAGRDTDPILVNWHEAKVLSVLAGASLADEVQTQYLLRRFPSECEWWWTASRWSDWNAQLIAFDGARWVAPSERLLPDADRHEGYRLALRRTTKGRHPVKKPITDLAAAFLALPPWP